MYLMILEATMNSPDTDHITTPELLAIRCSMLACARLSLEPIRPVTYWPELCCFLAHRARDS